MHSIFLKQHYGAESVFIDGVEYIAAGSIDNRLSRTSKMFLFDAPFELKCERKFGCS
jgi:hypothetical protein